MNEVYEKNETRTVCNGILRKVLKVLLTGVITIAVVVVGLLVLFEILIPTQKACTERNWGIRLPDGMQELYCVATGGRDSNIYSVYALTEEPTEFLSDFNREKDAAFEAAVLEKCAFFFAGENGIDPEYMVSFAGEYYSKTFRKPGRETSDRLYIVYDPNSQRMFLYEFFL